MRYDEKLQQVVPAANAAFIFITREGNIGLIETIDRITETADLTGTPSGMAPAGVGFHRGVQCKLSSIIP